MNARFALSLCALILAATAFAAEPNVAASPAMAPTPSAGDQGHATEHMQAMMKACMAKQGEAQKQCREKMKSEHMKSMSGMKGDMKGMNGMQSDGHPDHGPSPAAPAMPAGHDHDPKN